MKVLVVDDDSDQLCLRGLLIQQAGFETVEALDAPAALSAARTEHPDCAVVDLRLPSEAVGRRLIVDLKRLDPDIHVLVLTGDPHGLELERSPEAKLVDDVLLKGSSSRELMDRLRNVAARNAVRR